MPTPANADSWDVRVVPNPNEQWPPNMVEVERGTPSVAEQPAGQFLFMDCGLWAGSGTNHERRRNFGIVYGHIAVICNFGHPNTGNYPAQRVVSSHTDVARPINDLLQSIAGRDNRLTVVKPMAAPGLMRDHRNDRLHVFIPDMHFPVLLGLPPSSSGAFGFGSFHRPDGPVMGRWEYLPPFPDGVTNRDDGTVGPRRDTLGENAVEWFVRNHSSEIHEDASTDFKELLTRLEGHRGGPALRLVQLGDMIDMWMGFDAFFENTPPNAQDVVLTRGGREFVNYWIDRATGRAANLVVNTGVNQTALRRLDTSPLDKVFLWGNHDCYFARNTPAGIGSSRVRDYWNDGLFAEHGHRGDAFNRDGSRRGLIFGHRVTNQVFAHPWIRNLEGYFVDPRRGSLQWAGWQWYERWTQRGSTPQLSIYVMGHTHLQGLGVVRVFSGRRPVLTGSDRSGVDAP
jgi:hypothetical protein